MKTPLCLVLLLCSISLVAQEVKERRTSAFGIFYAEDFTPRWFDLHSLNKDKNYSAADRQNSRSTHGLRGGIIGEA